MKESLKRRLHEYIVEHNPELLLKLQEGYSISQYIDDKVELAMTSVAHWLAAGIHTSEAEQMALNSMTIELRPSRYLYLKQVLEEEFPKEAEVYVEAGVLTFELVNLIEHSNGTFDSFNFSEINQQDRKLRYAIIADIASYLN